MNQNFTKVAFTDSVTREEIAGEIAKLNPDILKSCCPDDIK